ncbi:ferredoxin--nitrite reductase [Anaerocolumna cellulosilytica]|uniref:Ferredoxin--nitrite reductase n=1 Tax=Anaerocolumna cellulosilytica TaxID=433286 RepID=A0A6S6R1H1_9FIRM|nr:nitrite/sulfite reductase [Anaerocolumna cellulosilytica]MBB5195394.1 ferredoxin-nitrite reductase [Anaerocolumna cellulosilytica]BCJ95926.1 ferredoxin--nitrite reductase [Anaerocolumna cellulosilytica]
MKEYNAILLAEIPAFREIGHQFVKKEISVAEFKGKSGGMGVYAQKGGEKFMLRLRTPSGVLSDAHLKLLGTFAEEYQLKFIHLTTRQAIQLHDLEIDSVCDIMEKAIHAGLYTRGAGGNFPRNITLSPLSGVEEGEAFDVTPYALLAGEYIMESITKYHLPRKLKIAFSNNEKDTACATVNDLGFMAVKHDGKPYFKVFLAGGLGNNPALSLTYDKLISPEEVLYHVEAVTRIFMAEGDYENKGKARLRYVAGRMGVKEFLDCYEKHLAKVQETLPELKQLITEKIQKQSAAGINWDGGTTVCQDGAVSTYKNLIPQKQSGLYTVELHPLGGILSSNTLFQLIDFLEGCKKADMRLTMSESIYIRNLEYAKALELLALTKDACGQSDIEKSISCIGVPTCQIGIEQSQELLKEILNFIKEQKTSGEYLPSIYISGCNNSCARHQVTEIGFTGSKKRIDNKPVDVFELYVGGHVGDCKTKLGTSMGFMKKDEIPVFMKELADLLNTSRQDFSSFYKDKKDEFDKLTGKYVI